MIITRPKDRAEILRKLAPYRRVALLGCGLCATACGTGGKKEVAALAAALAEAGKDIVWTEVVDGVCQRPLTERAFSRQGAAEAVVVMACGSGLQTAAGVTAMKAVAALDSVFLGSILRAGRFERKCSLCGDCRADEFGGLCPITLCPKSLLNGPCGGMDAGRCETDPEKDCVWHLIWLRKQEAGDQADLEPIVPPRSRLPGAP